MDATPVSCSVEAWLNSFKVTETVLLAQQALITLARRTLPRKGGSTRANIMRTGLQGLKR
ncbi:MAG: hypothetical protein EAZ39_08645 [Oscillatoriales cyanobacterium]|nr:MAG: hypothetical protein EAZ39_08645 [Oscillatoriales cyanobacterium]TAG56090.1 MAG: hypothetical protein EAZ28_20785 [Oscillatoriales cyanobacterium]